MTGFFLFAAILTSMVTIVLLSTLAVTSLRTSKKANFICGEFAFITAILSSLVVFESNSLAVLVTIGVVSFFIAGSLSFTNAVWFIE